MSDDSKMITFSLYDPNDVDKRYLPYLLDTILEDRGYGNRDLSPYRDGRSLPKFSSMVHTLLIHGELDIGPKWKMTKEEYESCWYDVHDNRIFAYLMVGIPGWMIKSMKEILGYVPSPFVSRNMYERYGPSQEEIERALKIIVSMREYIENRFGTSMSVSNLIEHFGEITWYDETVVTDIDPDLFVFIASHVIVGRSELGSSRLLGKVMSLALEHYESMAEEGYDPDEMEPEAIYQYLTLLSVPNKMTYNHIQEAAREGLLGDVYEIVLDSKRKGLRGYNSTNILRMAKMVRDGIPREWAENAVLS